MTREQWNCDFCNRAGLSISSKGDIYCRYCERSYEETIYDLIRKLTKEVK